MKYIENKYFHANYQYLPDYEYPSGFSPPPYHFRPGNAAYSNIDLCLQVTHSSGYEWWGVFDSEGYSCNAICVCPHPDYIFVIAGGQGYLINTLEPEMYTIPRICPILNMTVLNSEFGIMIQGFCSLQLLTSSGFSDVFEICPDELVFMSYSDNIIEFSGYDPASNEYCTYRFDLLSKKVI